ncbi:cytochrome bd oxidase small subunit CydS [Paenibacillus turpanensis]
MTMQGFLIFIAPPLVVAASVGFLFYWSAKSSLRKLDEQ